MSGGIARIAEAVAGCLILLLLTSPVEAASAKDLANPSGFPLPRYVSLKASKVNARRGPGYEYPVAWIYERAGLPVEVIKEYDTWRQIRDSEGSTGWVLQSLLSGRRTALVLPWDMAATPPPTVAIHRSKDATASVVVQVEAGTMVTVEECDKSWCTVEVVDPAHGTFSGAMEQRKLWGVYADEAIP